jgi:hypothetical protein
MAAAQNSENEADQFVPQDQRTFGFGCAQVIRPIAPAYASFSICSKPASADSTGTLKA